MLCYSKQTFISNQDYKHNMNEYSSWDLENTASIINDRFPESNVIVVKPKQMYENTYARYKNFVTCDKNGVPSHSSGQHSWQHLKSLLSSCCSKMVQNQFEKILTVDQLNSLPLILVGFSKGCVVLNQLLYDLPDASDEIFSFVGNVEKMIWLDGGHSGPSNTWINDNSVLEKAVKSGIKFETHVTPYQVKDKNRPWIGKEYAEFVRILKGLGAEVEDKLHFEKNPVSLSGHFSLLISF